MNNRTRRKPNPARERMALLERMYLRMFIELAIARFKWENLPDSVDARFLETTLYYKGLSIFFKHKDFDQFLALGGSGQNMQDHYGNPTTFLVMGENGLINKQLSNKECVPIWNNAQRIPDHDISMIYATKMADIERTIELNIASMRTPYVFFVDDNEKHSVLNAYNQIREGQPVIVGTNVLGEILENKAKILDMRIDKDQPLTLQLVKAKQWNECMTFLGINNANQDKRERLVTSEVSANNSQVLMARQVSLNARRQAVEKINKMFDLDIKVEWNVDVDTIAAEASVAAQVMES